MKKTLTVIAGIAAAGSFMCNVMAAGAAERINTAYQAGYTVASEAKGDPVVEDPMTAPNPFADVKTLKEASEVTGLKMSAPSKIKGYDNISYQVIKGEKSIQIIYKKDDNNSIIIRKAVFDKDVSGDYDEYKNVKEITIKGRKVTVKGNGKKYSLAIWRKGKTAYSVGIYNEEHGTSLKQLKKIVSKVK